MTEFFRPKYEKPSAVVGFYREQAILFPSSDPENTEERGYLKLLVEGYIEGRPGKVFTLNSLANEIECDSRVCYEIIKNLETEGLVERLVEKGNGKRGRNGRFRSLAPELPVVVYDSSCDNRVDKDILEDYYYTIERGIQEKKARGKPTVRSI